MPLIFLPRKAALILLVVLGIVCVVDGIYKKDLKETLIMAAILIYAIVSLINDRKKKLAEKNPADTTNSVNSKNNT